MPKIDVTGHMIELIAVGIKGSKHQKAWKHKNMKFSKYRNIKQTSQAITAIIM